MSERLERFGRIIDDAIDTALKEGCEPDDLEMVLQERAQDMREYNAETDADGWEWGR